MYTKKIFWIIITILIILSVVFLVKYFPQVMTFINLDIKMDRQEALLEAEKLVEELDIGPETHESAAIFSNDNMTQIYIELEAGGVERFNQMIKGSLYKPYTWNVRLFSEGKTNEANVYFTPEGKPYGFDEKLAESYFRESISSDFALEIAQNFITNDWNLDLADYQLVETKNHQTVSGRIDHTFVYERPQKINEARYRMQIVVAGNKVSKLYHYIKIPESFIRKYQEMRSANNTIAMIGQIAMMILYGIGGIFVGIFLLLRKKWILWKEALILAAIIAVLGILANLNSLPMYWNWYDTALAKGSFLFNQIMQFIISGTTDFILLALTFIAAESLTRKAFPQHTNFWMIWKKGSSNSTRTLGNTIAGYYVAVLSLVFIVTFYYITTKYFHWWNPASLAVSPNSLATPLPWLPAIANAFHAGFWEEALFRAIPLAGAALIGDKFGKRKLFIGLALIIEALIFGAGHANYAAQPAYARLVELIIPSLYFAFLYLRFGLFTGALMHFTFDAMLMSMPIWVSSGSTLWISRILFIIFFLLPLIVILISRLRTGKWVTLPDSCKNLSWKPPIEKIKIKKNEIQSAYNPKKKIIVVLIILGIIGFIFWSQFGIKRDFTTPMKIDKNQAIEIAKETLVIQDIEISDEWKILVSPINSTSNEDRLLWEQLGKEKFGEEYLNYLKPSYWNIRFAKFSGDVANRAEEYNIRINSVGVVISYRHSLPEAMVGSNLTKNEALDISNNELEKFYKLNIDELTEISASPSKLPERTDWHFTYSDTVNYKLQKGEMRYFTHIAGDKTIAIGKFLFVPEDWTRSYENKTRTPIVISNLFNMIYILILFSATILAIIFWSKKQFNIFFFIILLVFSTVIVLLKNILGFPLQMARFSTSQPWNNQLSLVLSSSIVTSIIGSIFIGITAGWCSFTTSIKEYKAKRMIHGLAWGFIFLGVKALIEGIRPEFQPVKTSIANMGSYMPMLSDTLIPIASFLFTTTIIFAFIQILNLVYNSGKIGKKLSFLFILLVSLIYFGKSQLVLFVPGVIIAWLFSSLAVSVLVFIFYRQLIRFDKSAIVLIGFVITFFPILRWGTHNLYNTQFVGVLVGSILLLPISYIWYRGLQK